MVEKKHKLILLGLFVSLLIPISLLIYTYAFTESWSYFIGYNEMKIREVPVAITPDGSFIVAGNNDGKLCIFHRSSSTPLWINTEVGRVQSVAISSNGAYIAVLSSFPQYLNKLYLFSRLNSTPMWEFSFSGSGSFGQLVMSSDGNYIVIASSDIYFFHKSSSTPLWNYTTIDDTITSVDMSSDGSCILAGQRYGVMVYFFNSSGPIPLWNYTSADNIYSIAISSNGRFAAVGTDELLLFNTSTLSPNVPIWKYDTGASIVEVDISSEGNYIVASSNIQHLIPNEPVVIDRNVYLFNNLNSTPKDPLWIHTTKQPGSATPDISITPNGNFILVGGIDGVLLYARTDSIPFFRKDIDTGSLAISADGKYFVVGSVYTFWFIKWNNPALIEELLGLTIFNFVMIAISSIGIIITYSIIKKRIPI